MTRLSILWFLLPIYSCRTEWTNSMLFTRKSPFQLNYRRTSEIRKRRIRAIRKNEARILCKVILDTWRFILGYIAKYRWILFRGSFLLSDSVLSWFHWVWNRQTSSPKRGQERQLKQCNSKASDNWFSMTSTSLSIGSVCEEEKCIVKQEKSDRLQTRGKFPIGTGKFPYKGI